MRNAKSKTLLFSLTVIALVGAGTAAFAFWSGAGSGSGSAPIDAATSSSLVINQTTTVASMAPGVAAQTLSGTFTNNATDATPVEVTSVTASVSSVTLGGTTLTSCTASDFVITNATMAVNASVPVGTSVGSWTGAQIAFDNTASNQDACKGATVHLAYVAQ